MPEPSEALAVKAADSNPVASPTARRRRRRRRTLNSQYFAMASFLHWIASSSSAFSCSAFIASSTTTATNVAASSSSTMYHLVGSSSNSNQDFISTRPSNNKNLRPVGGQIATSSSYSQHASSSASSPKQQPSWILGHLAESNILKLKSALHKSQASLDTISRTLDAVRMAAGSDMNKMAGAAEFCHILVDVMEMGQQTDALIAAAYHYCSCVTARETQISNTNNNPEEQDEEEGAEKKESSSWMHDTANTQVEHEFEQRYIQPLTGISSQAKMIAVDAAKLKRIETTASSILPNPSESDILRHLILSTSGDWRALAIRSAACLYRLRGVESNHTTRQQQGYTTKKTSYYTQQRLSRDEIRFCREALHVYSPLASRMGMHRLKNKMDDMAFRLLYPRQYATASSIMCQQQKNLGIDMRTLLDSLTAEVKELLKDDPIISRYTSSILVCGRTKEPLSLWRKIILRDGLLLSSGRRKKGSISSSSSWLLPADALALRIVLEPRQFLNEEPEAIRARETALCYYVQQLCLKHWKPYSSSPPPPLQDAANKNIDTTPCKGRFKDYIRHPKPNGYQSLHYTASTTRGNQNLPFEIQIRSMAMHHVAEVGLAAHFDYKNTSNKGSSCTSNVSFLEERQHNRNYADMIDHTSHTLHLNNNNNNNNVDTTASSSDNLEEVRQHGASDSTMSIYLDALSTAKNDLTRNVFVFLAPPSSFQAAKIISLRAGSCIVDAMREGERQFGSNKVRWRRRQDNVGQEMTRRLKNGDVLAM